MTGISSYTSVAASNTTWFPENMNPSAVNDGMRQVQADIRSGYVDSQWADWGDVPSRASATTFKIATDVTSRYIPNRAIRTNDAATYYGIITASSYSAPDTTVTVNLDSGSLTASLTAIAIASLSPTNRSLPTAIGRKGSDCASASTINLSAYGGDFVDVTGTTTITAITSEAAGIRRKVRFTGALTLTHNATSLILPGVANITTAANDRAEFISLDGTNWLCFDYTTASGLPLISGAPFIDSTAIIKGSGDATKLVRIEADGITTGTTRVWTAPNCDVDKFLIGRASGAIAAASGTSSIPLDNTIPQISEGTELVNFSYTPKSTSNIINLSFSCQVFSGSASVIITVALFQSGSNNAIIVRDCLIAAANSGFPFGFSYEFAAPAASAITFSARIGINSGTWYVINGPSYNYGSIALSQLALKEYSV